MNALVTPIIHKAAGADGPAILLIHGFGADRLIWLANQQDLAAAGRVYALDLPGHGETPRAGAGRLDDLVAAVARALDAAAIAPVHVVAHSLGAAVAIALAARRPDLVRSLALIAAAGLGRGVDEGFLLDYPRAQSPGETETLLRRLVSRPRLINRFMVARAREQLNVPGAREGLIAIAEDLKRIDAILAAPLQAVAASALPRLAIWGEMDAVVPLDRARLARLGAESLILADAAHLPHIEAPRAVNERLLTWLSALR